MAKSLISVRLTKWWVGRAFAFLIFSSRTWLATTIQNEVSASRSRKKAIAGAMRWRVQELWQLASLRGMVTPALVRAVRRHEKSLLLQRYSWYRFSQFLGDVLQFSGVMAALFLAPLLATLTWSYLNIQDSGVGAVSKALYPLTIILLFGAFRWLEAVWNHRYRLWRIPYIVLVLLAVGLTTGVGLLLVDVPSPWSALLLALVFGIAAQEIGVSAGRLVRERSVSSFDRVASALQPDAFLAEILHRMMLRLERHPDAWADPRFRRRLLMELESAARCVERDLLRHLRTGDADTNTWVTTSTGEIASALRSLKKWVCLPKPDTREQLMARLSRLLMAALRGDYDTFERVPVEQPLRSKVRRLAMAFAGTMFVLSTPLIVLYAYRASGLDDLLLLPPFVEGGAAFVIMLSVAWVLDPTLPAKVAVLKQATESLPGLRGGK